MGISAEIHQLPEDVTQEQLEEEVQRVCADSAMDGVLVQLPLPRHLDEERAMEFLEPRKDVDGFHPLNMGCVCVCVCGGGGGGGLAGGMHDVCWLGMLVGWHASLGMLPVMDSTECEAGMPVLAACECVALLTGRCRPSAQRFAHHSREPVGHHCTSGA